MDFIRKNASEFQSGYTGYYLKPATRPHCGVGTDAVVTAREVFPFTGNANLLFPQRNALAATGHFSSPVSGNPEIPMRKS